ncbi:hypothetical protein ACSMFR_12995 [Listeria aquatica]|uniref:hypothetical protein n=1 Tax=Listeria aquatica TaxID=1494960 RepID=UPI003F6F999A
MLGRITLTHVNKEFNKQLATFLSEEGYEVNVEQENQALKTDILINGVYELNEQEFLDRDKTSSLIQFREELLELFQINKIIVTEMMKSKKGTVLFLFNPNEYGGFGEYNSPILTLAKLSFMKSIAKELNAFNVNCFGITLAPNKENLKVKQMKKEKQLDIFTLKQKPISLEQQFIYIERLFENSEIFGGQTINLTNGPNIIF